MTALSIIVPFYNETAYLRTALNSIRSQRIDDVQIIVINDNPEFFDADDLAALGVRRPVELVHHPRNLGLSAARNSGLQQARGQFIGFLDSDDYYTLGGLANQLQQAISTQADITHAPTYFTHKGSAETRILPRDQAFFSQIKTARKGLMGAQEAQFITSSWSSLYSRAFLTSNQLRFDAEQTRFEDRLFVLHTVTRAKTLTFTGIPSRVWRGREGSISVTATSPDIHLLQIQLLEKCLSHIRAEIASGALPPRFEKRELFNTVSRLIWDLDMIETIVRHQDTKDTPIYADIARRIPLLLGNDSFSHSIFDDKILEPISRVGMKTRKGRITRTTFFAIHSALRNGDIVQAHNHLLSASGDAPRHPAPTAVAPPRSLMSANAKSTTSRPRLILHLGMHKTGSTYIQAHLKAHRARLRKAGILVPTSGFYSPDDPVRDGASPGHQGFVTALRQDDPAPWAALEKEMRATPAHTVLLSCENMAFPTLSDRDRRVDALADRLGMFDHVDLVALVRRPDTYTEAFYREHVANGARLGTGGIDAFLNDHSNALTDLPDLFAPFETRFSTRIRLADFDQQRGIGLWPGFLTLAGLPADLPVLDVPRYPTPDRDTILLLQALSTLVPDIDLRNAILHAWFSLYPNPAPNDTSLLSPETRLQLLDRWQEKSADFAAARGYAPDLSIARTALARENWTPATTLPADKMADLLGLAAQAAGPLFSTTAPHRAPARPAINPAGMALTIRLRPWLANLLRKTRR